MIDATQIGPRRAVADTAALTVGAAVNGAGAYAFVALGTRAVGAAGFAPVSILWSVWAALAAVITFPVQHWIIRTIVASGGDEARVRGAMRQLASATAVMCVAVAVGSYLLRRPLFGRSDPLFPVLVGVIPLGSTLIGIVRGTLAGRGRFVATGAAIAAENVVRVLAGVIVLALAPTSGALGVGVVVGFGVVLFWPDALQPGRRGRARFGEDSTSQLTFLAGIAGGSLIAQLVLTVGPVVLALLGGPDRSVTALFAALALFRAPYLLALGASTKLTSVLTLVASRSDDLDKLRVGLGAAGPVTAALAAGIGATIGPVALRILFGPESVLPTSELAWVAGASGLALVNLFVLLLLLVLGRSAEVTWIWLIALVAGAVALVMLRGEPLLSVIAGLAVSEAVAFMGCLAISSRGVSVPTRGSTHEDLRRGRSSA